jgi:uncharacterized protein
VTDPARATLLRSVDRAAFVVALGHRLRRAGVPVTTTALASFTHALGLTAPRDVRELYWAARVTLVNRSHDLDTFDAVFEAVFDAAALPLAGQAAGPAADAVDEEVLASVDAQAPGEQPGEGLPWHTLPRSVLAEDTDQGADGPVLPELLPSAVLAVADVPFEQLDPVQLALVGGWLEQSRHRWPSRRSRRRRVHHAGRRIELRETIAASRRTGWEPVELSRSRPVRRPRTVTMVADVSQSMQPYSAAYLHLMRALARSRRAETFAFSTSLTRVTAALRHRSVEVAISEASDLVVDRFGGTHLATSLGELLRSRHGNTLRGGVLVVASDGWDSDDPEQLARVLARVRRRVHRLVWLNPRAGSAGFEPLVGSMAAALPFCDEFLPAHTLRATTDALDAILGPGSRLGG